MTDRLIIVLRRRWRLEWRDFDRMYVMGPESKEEAYPLLREQWQKRLDSMDGKLFEHFHGLELEFEHAKICEVGHPNLKYVPRPGCCVAADTSRFEWESPPIRLKAHRAEWKEWKDNLKVDPHWTIQIGDSSAEIFFCPFCGSKLPALARLETAPQPMWTSDGDDCGTCGECWQGCECNPPEAAYVIDHASRTAQIQERLKLKELTGPTTYYPCYDCGELEGHQPNCPQTLLENVKPLTLPSWDELTKKAE